MVLGCVWARPALVAVAVLLLAVPFIALRICAEEQLLLTRSRYRDYAERVRWRLVPGVW